MAKKSWKKKQAYQAYCRDQVKKGLINDESGNWTPHNAAKAMHNHMLYGYRLGG